MSLEQSAMEEIMQFGEFSSLLNKTEPSQKEDSLVGMELPAKQEWDNDADTSEEKNLREEELENNQAESDRNIQWLS